MTAQARLSAAGGDSGYSSNTSDYCASGGGGGVIQIFSSDIEIKGKTDVRGGKGLDSGEDGVKWFGGT